jgi:LuxR family maltose regulon positive regulatory protein
MQGALGLDVARAVAADHVPAVAHDVVLRPSVLGALERAAGSVVVITAPAGYGKTSHVAAWAAGEERAVAWIDVDVGHNDPQVLLDRIVGALCSVTDLAMTPFAAAAAEQWATISAPALGRAVRACTRPFVLVVDDVHAIDNPSAVDLLAAITGNVPDHGTIVLIGRAVPPTPLARLRVDSRMVEIGPADLALGPEDAQVIAASAGLAVTDGAVTAIVEDTEGWPVGIRLALDATVRARSDAEPDGRVHGDERAIAGYLREQWLRDLKDADRTFLLQTSCLDWLSGPLCDAVLRRTDSGGVLERLHEERLLLIPMDRRGHQYRLHRLLRDVLEAEAARADRAQVRRTELRASEWFESCDDIDGAVRHALRAGDHRRAERLVVEHSPVYQTTGRHATVRRWLESIPDQIVMDSPGLCLVWSSVALGDCDVDASTAWIRFGHAALGRQATPDHVVGLRLSTLRAVIDPDPGGESFAGAAAAYREFGAGPWRALACEAHALRCHLDGDDDEAIRVLAEGRTEARVARTAAIEARCGAHLAWVHGSRGDWRSAAPVARAARDVVRANRLEGMPTLILVTSMSALVDAMNGRASTARADVLLTRRNLAFLGGVGTIQQVQARLAVARACLLLGDRVGAQIVLDEARESLATTTDRPAPLQRQFDDLDQQVRMARSDPHGGPSSLTTAELRLLHFLPTNLTYGEIAARLGVSRNTVKTHAASIYRKLAASSRGEAVDVARATGLLPHGDDVHLHS